VGPLFSNIVTDELFVGKPDIGCSYFTLSLHNANRNALDVIVSCNKLPELLHFSLARRPALGVGSVTSMMNEKMSLKMGLG